jgi:hypothetical protein
VILGREGLTAAQNATLDAVIAAHDPSKLPPLPPPQPTLADVTAVLSPDQQTAIQTAVAAKVGA